MRDPLKEKLDDHVVVFDGAVGTELYRRDFFINTSYEGLNLSHPSSVREIHRSYVEAGAEVLTTNSYGANRNKLMRFGLAEKTVEINQAAVNLAKAECTADTLVAGSVGPVGDGASKTSIPEHVAVEMLGEQMVALQAAGADFILCETIPSLSDAEIFYQAIVKHVDIPFMFSFAVERNLETPTGEPLQLILELFEKGERRPSAIGLNCINGAEGMLSALESLLPATKYPVVVRPNAGMPKNVDNRMIYMCSPEYLTTYAVRYVNLGARGVGGCCGTGPEHIRDIARSIKPLAGKLNINGKIKVVRHCEQPKEPIPAAQRSELAAALCDGRFVTTVEITPPRGFDLSATIAKAAQCREAGIDAINIPDGPRASSRISPIITAHEIQEKAGIEVILHCCCRDKNLIGMQADLLGCSCQGINNILFITGDPPKLGDYPFASAVFDVDSIGILRVADNLNHGIDVGGKGIEQPTAIFAGAGADPNSIDMERELKRLREKVDAGASFIITQPVFSVDSLFAFMDSIADLNVPVIAGVWPLASYRNAEFMKNEVPGVTIPDRVMSLMAAAKSREEQHAVGIMIARETVEAMRPRVQGVQVSAPFGNVNSAIEVISCVKK